MSRYQLFPEAALDILRQARFDEKAVRKYEKLSGGFWWSDERIYDVVGLCMEVDSHAYQYALAFRASLSNGTPRDDLRDAWDQLLRECPNWPGFRLERRATSLASELQDEWNRVEAQLEDLFDRPR
jgi:hypothetical protein